MIINHQYKFIYLKTHKTASTSLEIALSKFCGPQDIITEISEKDEIARKELGYPGPQNDKIAFKHYSFRDWGRWLFLQKAKKFYNHIPAVDVRKYIPHDIWDNYYIFTFERNPFDKAISRFYWDLSNMEKKSDIDINEYLVSIPAHRLSNWEIYTIDDKVVADRIFLYENMEDCLKEIEAKLDLPDSLKLPRAKGSHRKAKTHHKDLLTPETIETIRNHCKKEIQLFGYEP